MDEDVCIESVTVRRTAAVPEALEGAVQVGPYSVARPGMLLRVVPGLGRFLAKHGETLEYWAEEGADPAEVTALLKGGVLGALIHQRGELPLHATTLLAPDGISAFAIAGHSGAGKSTTAFALARRGWVLLSDDLTRITLRDGLPTVWPGKSRLRLMEDACVRFGLDIGGLTPAPNWPGKYEVQPPMAADPVPLAGVVVLERGTGELAVERLRAAAALRALAGQAYRPHYVAALGQAKRHFELLAATASAADILRVRGEGEVEQVAQALEDAVRSGLTDGSRHETEDRLTARRMT